ncbi:MAG: DUF547 domain-containing protein, partial [Acidobacteriota bacterium]
MMRGWIACLILLFCPILYGCGSSAPPTSGPPQTKGTSSIQHKSNKSALLLETFDALLAKYVRNGRVDYQRWYTATEDRHKLDQFVAALADKEITSGLSRAEQQAIWLNGYNAIVIKEIFAHYPIDSVRSVPGFFKELKTTVAGQQLSLDEIETTIRQQFADPRIHFVLVCGAKGCPALQPFAYQAAKLEEQLDQVTHEFLANQERGLRYQEKQNRLYLSNIFQWYAEDFGDVVSFV